MSFDGNGTFLRIMNWVQDAASGIKIKADRHDSQDDDFANGLSNTITKDGQSSPTNDIPMNDHKIINLADPINDQDAATKKYADTIKPSTSGFEISGADANGLLKFTSLTGANGLSWTGADMSWLARLAGAPAGTLARLVLNSKKDGTGTDVITMNKDGSATFTKGLTVSTTIVAGGAITAGAIVAAKAAAGNVHFWFYGPAGEDRGLIYANAAAAGSMFLRTSGQQTFEFNNSGQFKAPNALFAGASYHGTDGNIVGSVWQNFAGTATDAYSAIAAQIEARGDAYRAAAVSVCVTAQRMAGEISFNRSGVTGKWQNGGYVFTGVQGSSNGGDAIYFARQPQHLINGAWATAFPF